MNHASSIWEQQQKQLHENENINNKNDDSHVLKWNHSNTNCKYGVTTTTTTFSTTSTTNTGNNYSDMSKEEELDMYDEERLDPTNNTIRRYPLHVSVASFSSSSSNDSSVNRLGGIQQQEPLIHNTSTTSNINTNQDSNNYSKNKNKNNKNDRQQESIVLLDEEEDVVQQQYPLRFTSSGTIRENIDSPTKDTKRSGNSYSDNNRNKNSSDNCTIYSNIITGTKNCNEVYIDNCNNNVQEEDDDDGDENDQLNQSLLYYSDIDIENEGNKEEINDTMKLQILQILSNSNNNSISTVRCGYMICFLLAITLPITFYYEQQPISYFHLHSSTITTTITNKSHHPQQHLPHINIPKQPLLLDTLQSSNNIIIVDSPLSNNNNIGVTMYEYPKKIPNIVWFMSYPGTTSVKSILYYIEEITQTTTATNYGSSSSSSSSSSKTITKTNDDKNNMNNNTTTAVVQPMYHTVHPDYQCGPYIHRTSNSSSSIQNVLPLPSTNIITHTQCIATTSNIKSSSVCTECPAKYHNTLSFLRGCATGNQYYERHVRSVQYDTHLSDDYRIVMIQNPFHTILNRLRITFQQKLFTIDVNNNDIDNHHHSDYFLQYLSSYNQKHLTKTSNEHYNDDDTDTDTSISIIDYCNFLDRTYELLHTTDLLENHTHVPCHSEIYQYIQWYNSAISITTPTSSSNATITNEKRYYLYYEDIVNRTTMTAAINDLLAELNLWRYTTNGDDTKIKNMIQYYEEQIVYEANIFGWYNDLLEQWYPKSYLIDIASMIYDFTYTTNTYPYIQHYIEPYVQKHNTKDHHLHLFRHHHHQSNSNDIKRHSSNHDQPQQLIPLSYIFDSQITDDSMIVNPLLLLKSSVTNKMNNDTTISSILYENPFLQVDEIPMEPNDSNPEVVWLMSFPNSGTSYTINNLEVTCNVTTGSNYAKDWEVVVPVRPELRNGPFIHDTEMRVPHYVLTKTHCYGYCDDCAPDDYNITTNLMFEQGCLRVEMPNRTGRVQYENTVPVKAVHLYRNPYDNIVARMHLAVHKRERQGGDVSSFTNSREGVNAWCKYLDDKYVIQEEEFFSPTLMQILSTVPCHADWYRYVMWHNHAHIMTERLNLPVYDLYYEDYTHDYEATIQTLFDYVQVTPRQPPVDFYVGKSYEVFFEKKHKRNAAKLVKAISLPVIWERLKHYFEEYL